jgi:hypothetical protein
MDYQVVSSWRGAEDLTRKVKALIAEQWEPQGGVAAMYDSQPPHEEGFPAQRYGLFQAMIKHGEQRA